MNQVDPEVFATASLVARELIDDGAEAVVLTGSHARGDAHPQSDLDIYAVGDGSEYLLERRGALLVSMSWRTRGEIASAFLDPGQVGTFVPGWRRAVILEDLNGFAARTIERAKSWTWDAIDRELVDRHVAQGITGYAEEVHKLVVMLGRGEHQAAAVQRSVLALRLPILLSVHLRLLYDTENMLWDLVAEQLGDDWSRAQAAALGVGDPTFEETCVAALTLFTLACTAVEPLFDDREKRVVQSALTLARVIERQGGPSVSLS